MIKDCNYLLVRDSFEKLEFKLVKEYIFYFGKPLTFQYLYTDCLAKKLRPSQVNLKRYSQSTLRSDDLQIESQTEPKKFIMFLKFLKFTTNLDYKTKRFNGDPFQVVIFRVKDFLDVFHSQRLQENLIININ